jgi:IS5 family transposase
MQPSFPGLDYASRLRETQRDQFLRQTEAVAHCEGVSAKFAPFYPKGAGRGWLPFGVEGMLPIYVPQQRLGLSDEIIEDAIYVGEAIGGFIGIELNHETAPDATTDLKFLSLQETNKLPERIVSAINKPSAAQELLLPDDTVLESTIVRATSSTRNKNPTHDTAMPNTKYNQWHFLMKGRIAAEAYSGLTQTVITTEANVSDITQAHTLSQGDKSEAFSVAGYEDVATRRQEKESVVKWNIALLTRKCKALPDRKTL